MRTPPEHPAPAKGASLTEQVARIICAHVYVRRGPNAPKTTDVERRAAAEIAALYEARIAALEAERDEALRRAAPISKGGPGPRREAAKKLLCDICACSAEVEPASLDLPHVVADCLEPLETLLAERDACLFMSQQAAKYAGRDGHDILDAIGEKHVALAKARDAEAKAAALTQKWDALQADNARLAGELEKEDVAHLRTIDQRDHAEEMLSKAYSLVTGRIPEWSNLFGYTEALDDITEASEALRSTAEFAQQHPLIHKALELLRSTASGRAGQAGRGPEGPGGAS